MTKPTADLTIQSGRILYPNGRIEHPGSIAINGDRIIAVGPNVHEEFGGATLRLNFPNALMVPGLIDFHAHPSPVGWFAGIDPEEHILGRGTTTVLSQGDPSCDTWQTYRQAMQGSKRLRIKEAISPVTGPSFAQSGNAENLDNIDIEACVSAAKKGKEHIWGISVNVMVQVTGASNPKKILKKVLDIAEKTELPLLFGSRREPSDWPLADQLEWLRPGDVLTYCLHPGTETGDESIVNKGRIVDAVWKAQEKGILFDVGHGMKSFDFGVAEAAIAQGFMPDTISTDIQHRYAGYNPIHDMPSVISKLIASGMSEVDVLERSTIRPARALHMEREIGSLEPGKCADVTLLEWDDENRVMDDCFGSSRSGGYFKPIMTIKSGETVSP